MNMSVLHTPPRELKSADKVMALEAITADARFCRSECWPPQPVSVRTASMPRQRSSSSGVIPATPCIF